MATMKRKLLFIVILLSLSTDLGCFGFKSLRPFAKTIVKDTPNFVLTEKSRGKLFSTTSDNAVADDEKDVRGGGVQLSKVGPLPTMSEFKNFAIPCLGLWVAGPLLSLVDTTFVGLSGDASTSAEQLAALGPATTFCDGSFYLFAFLNAATTYLYSSTRAKYGDSDARTESVVRTAARLSLFFGFGLMVFMLVSCRSLLALYVGPESASQPHLLNWASEYVAIRAFTAPTYLLMCVLQAALLGAKDSVTPLIAILYSTITNIIGDYLLVSRFKMGLKGAAIATTLAQWASTWALMGPARQKLVADHNLGLTSNKHKKNRPAGSVTSGQFLVFAAPVITLILGKLAAFGFMTNSAAGLPGQPTTLACHQIILSLFFFISPFLEVISQTAQAFLPPFFSPVNEHITKMKQNNPSYDAETDDLAQSWLNAALAVSTRLLQIGVVVAAIVSGIVSLVPAFFGNLITTDPTVQEAVKPLAKWLWVGAMGMAPVAVAEGCLLASRQLPFLASVYVISTVILPFALTQVKQSGGPVTQVWACFAAFQLFRAFCFCGRIWGGHILKFVKNLFRGKRRNREGMVGAS